MVTITCTDAMPHYVLDMVAATVMCSWTAVTSAGIGGAIIDDAIVQLIVAGIQEDGQAKPSAPHNITLRNPREINRLGRDPSKCHENASQYFKKIRLHVIPFMMDA